MPRCRLLLLGVLLVSLAAALAAPPACSSTVRAALTDERVGYPTCVADLSMSRVPGTIAWAFTPNRTDQVCLDLNCTSALQQLVSVVADDCVLVQTVAGAANISIVRDDLRQLARTCEGVLFPTPDQAYTSAPADGGDNTLLMFFLWFAVGFLAFVYVVGWVTRHKWRCVDVERTFCSCCRDDSFDDEEDEPARAYVQLEPPVERPARLHVA